MRGKGLDVLSLKAESVHYDRDGWKSFFEGPLADFVANALTIQKAQQQDG